MSYQVLARKWRPNQFSEVIGQEHVITALRNGLNSQRLHHAYLFSGTRGVGKTSIARLFAKGLNCEKGITANPCGECENCRAIKDGNFIDLIEIDAASRTKVEDTRELLDNVQYKPVRGRFKIYLIDEVHMLSRHSFNALLKTLEEPPEYVKFLLATTDPQKLPITVLSRCIQFHLKALDSDVIREHLANLLTQEKVDYQLPALNKLAKAAQGSVRDALSLTDQAIALGNGNITTAAVDSMLGLLDSDKSIALLRSIAQADGEAAMQVLQEIAQQGVDWERVLQELAETLHQVAMLQLLPPKHQQADSPLAVLAKMISAEDVQFYYQLMLNGRKELAFAPEMKSGVEMTILRALAFHPKRFSSLAAIDTPQLVVAPPQSQKKNEPLVKTAEISVPTTVNQAVEPEDKMQPPETDVQGSKAEQRSSALLSSDILQQVANLEKERKAHIAVPDHHSQTYPEKKKEITESEVNIQPISDSSVMTSADTVNPHFVPDAQAVVADADNEPKREVATDTLLSSEEGSNEEAVEDGDSEMNATILTEDYHWSWSDPDIAKQQQVMRPSEIKSALLEKYTPEVVEKVVMRANAQSQWSAEIEKLQVAGVSKRILLNSVILARDENSLKLGVRPESFLLAKHLDLGFINDAFQTLYGHKIKIELEEYQGDEITPYELRGQIYQQMVEETKQHLQQDKKLNDFMQQFSAKIELDSVRPTGKA